MTKTVYTAPLWLFEMFNGYRNNKNTAMIKPILDANDTPIIGKSIIDDITWDLHTEVTSPDGETKQLVKWLIEIPYTPKEDLTPPEI